MSPIEITVRVDASGAASALGSVTSAAQGTAGALNSATASAGQLGGALGNVGQGAAGLNTAAGAAGNLGQNLNNAGQSATALADRFQSMQDIGGKLSDWGSKGLEMSANFIQAAAEGGDALAKLSAMLEKRGEGGRFEEMADWAGKLSKAAFMPDDDPINEASAGLLGFGINADKIQKIMPGLIGQSRLYNQSLESTAMAFGKAFAKGDAGALVKSGVTLDPADLEKLKGIEDHTQRQAMLFEMVSKSMDQYALSMNEGLSESTKQANLAANAMDSFTSNVGAGAAEAKASFQGIGTSVVEAANTFPELESALGKVFYVASVGASVFGQGLGLAGQIGMATLAFPGLGAAAVTSLTAANAAALPLLLTVGKIALVALAAAAALYVVDKALHAKEDAELAANIAAGDATDPQRLENSNKSRARRGEAPETMEQFKAREANPDGQPTGAAAMADPAAQIAEVKGMLAGTNNPPTGAPSPLAITASSSMPGASPLAGAFAASTSGSDIESLEDQIAGSTSKGEKAGLREQLRLSRRGQKHANQSEAEQKNREREAGQARKAGLRDTGLLAGADAAEATGALDEQAAGLRAGGELAESRDKRSLLAQVRVLKSQKDEGDAEQESALRSLYSARDKARQADLDQQIAGLEAEKALAEAGAKASALDGSAREAALRIGQARADRIRAVAAAKAQGAREEARDEEQEVQAKLRETGSQGKRQTGLAALFAAQRLKGSYDGGSGLATAGGGPFGMAGGNYGAGLPSFTGDSMQRLRDAANAQRAFSGFNLNRYGEDPSLGGASRGQGSQQRVLDVRIREIVTTILGETILRFQDVPLGNNGNQSGPLRAG